MQRHGGPLGGSAAFALTAGLACDNGGFDALSWNRALVLLCAVALVLVIVGGAERPGRWPVALLAALGFLTAWTAASWLWSDSPPLALVEAQRVALYLAAAALVVLAGRRVPPAWIAAGVVAACVLVAVWNLVLRIGGVHGPDIGAPARPVGYANSLALLCVLGLALLPALPRLAWIAAAPLAAVLVLQESLGAYLALAAGVLMLLHRRLRFGLVAVALIAVVAASSALRSHERTAYWRVAVREAETNSVLGSGAGTFRDWWVRERTVRFSTDEAHSLYLETLAELGPVALGAVLLALGIGVAAGVRARRPELAAAVLAYSVGAIVDFHWELAGVTVPAVLIAATAATQAAPGRGTLRRAVVVPVVVAFALAGLLAYAGNARLQSAHDALAAGDGDRAAALARQALRWAPFSADAWRVIGDAEASKTAYGRAAGLDPNDWYLWQRIGQLSSGGPRRRALRTAARLNPLLTAR